jgi:hypothetical protein
MKKLITVLMAIILLTACGMPETSEAVITTATNTATTSPKTTVAETTTTPSTTTTTKIIETTISNTETKTGNDLESDIRSILGINENIEIVDIEYRDIDFDGIDEMIVLTGGWPQNQIYCFSMNSGELELLGSKIQPFMCEYIRDLTDFNYRYFDVSKLTFFSVSYNDKDYIAYKYGSKSSYFATNSIDIIGIAENGEFFDEIILMSGCSKSISAEPTYEYYYQKKTATNMLILQKRNLMKFMPRFFWEKIQIRAVLIIYTLFLKTVHMIISTKQVKSLSTEILTQLNFSVRD